jgi:hypothetical protein
LPQGDRWFRGSLLYVIREDCRPFFIFTVVDISREKESQEALRYHTAFDNLLVHATSSLIQSSEENFDASLEQVLKSIGAFAGVDRAYVFRFEDQEHHTWVIGWHSVNDADNDCIKLKAPGYH